MSQLVRFRSMRVLNGSRGCDRDEVLPQWPDFKWRSEGVQSQEACASMLEARLDCQRAPALCRHGGNTRRHRRHKNMTSCVETKSAMVNLCATCTHLPAHGVGPSACHARAVLRDTGAEAPARRVGAHGRQGAQPHARARAICRRMRSHAHCAALRTRAARVRPSPLGRLSGVARSPPWAPLGLGSLAAPAGSVVGRRLGAVAALLGRRRTPLGRVGNT